MDILDRLSYLLRSALEEPDPPYRSRAAHADPDWRDAWKELDEYMRTGSATEAGEHRSAGFATAGRRGEVPQYLHKDFAALELQPGASIDEVRKAFRRELSTYHPDRFADDPEKFRTATAVTRELIRSYRRIRDYYGARV